MTGQVLDAYRDQRYLVVRTKSFCLPKRCVLTNEPIENENSPRLFYYLNLNLFASLKKQDAVPLEVNRVPLPLSSVHLELPIASRPQRSSNAWFFLLVFLGLFLVVSSSLVFAFCTFLGWPTWIAYLVGIVGLLITVFGTWRIIFQHAPLFVQKSSHGYVWIGGVHPEFLRDVPNWHGSTSEHCHQKSQASTLVIGGLGCLLVWVFWLVFGLNGAIEAWTSRAWKTTEGIITATSIHPKKLGPSSKGELARFELRTNYRFDVRGLGYTGNRIGLGTPEAYPTNNAARFAMDRQYPKDKKITVYYDPVEPSRCALNPASAWLVVSRGSPLLLLPLVGFTSLLRGSYLHWATRRIHNEASHSNTSP
jgi:hypothetical protein